MEIQVALDKLRNICSRQEKCPGDIVTLLKKWDVPPDDHLKIISQLKTERFIDETRYASAYVRDKIRFDHWGFIKIRIMLNQKGIDKSITERTIRDFDLSEYKAMMGSELKKKRRTVKGSPYEIWAKIARYGASRGYEMEYMQDFLGDNEGGLP